MKTTNAGIAAPPLVKRTAAATLAALVIGISGSAYADGTSAGTNIENTFELDYKINSVPQDTVTNDTTKVGIGYDVQGAPTAFTVDRKVDLTVQTLSSPLTVTPGGVGEPLFELTNTGNDNQSYSVSLEDIGSDDFDVSSLVINYCIDGNADDDFDDAGDVCSVITATPTGTTAALAVVTSDLAPDEKILFKVSGTILSTLSNGETDTIILLAETRDPLSWVEEGLTLSHRTVTAPDANSTNELEGVAENVMVDGTGVATVEGDGDGMFAAEGVFIVASSDITASKTVSVVLTEPVNCATDTAGGSDEYAAPGACMEYIIEVSNGAGAVTAEELDLSDQLPENVNFVSATLTAVTATGFEDDPTVVGVGPVLTGPTTGTACNGANCLVQLSDAQLAAGETGRIVMRVLVD